MKKRLFTMLLASAMVVSMAACGNTTSSSKATTSSKTTSSTTSSKAADSSTTASSTASETSSAATTSTASETSSAATTSTPAETSSAATVSTPAETSSAATASTPAETSTPATTSSTAGTTDSKADAEEHSVVGLWRVTNDSSELTDYLTFYDDGFGTWEYFGSGTKSFNYTLENDVLTLKEDEGTSVFNCYFDGSFLSLRPEGSETSTAYCTMLGPDEEMKDNITGMWKHADDEIYYYTFREDGQGRIYQPSRNAVVASFEYTIDGDQLKSTITSGTWRAFDDTVTMKDNDYTLVLQFNGSTQGEVLYRLASYND